MSIKTPSNEFKTRFRESPELLVQAPGRINIIGEHTDYNNGFVLPAAVSQSIYFAIGRSGHPSKCNLVSLDFDEQYDFDLNEMAPLPSDSWQNYILGVAAEITKSGRELEGFNMIFSGDVPKGSGMSSSAALECGTCFGLNELFDLGISKVDMVKLSQMAEHNYAGVKCGIMDQFASMMGIKDQALLLDCRFLDYKHFSIELKDYSLLLCNSNITHSLASSEYNVRRQQCEEGVSLLSKCFSEVKSLRDASMSQLQQVQGELPIAVAKRCKYIIEENERVQRLTTALSQSDFSQVGTILKEAHYAMRYEYEITCLEIDFMADFANDHASVLGARMMGGGFGGCVLVLLEKGGEDQFATELGQAYNRAYDLTMTPIKVDISDGVKLVQS